MPQHMRGHQATAMQFPAAMFAARMTSLFSLTLLLSILSVLILRRSG